MSIWNDLFTSNWDSINEINYNQLLLPTLVPRAGERDDMNKNNLYYPTGEEIHIGDIVKYGDTQGRIVFIVSTDSYSDNYPKEEWDYLKEGLGVQTEEYGLIHDLTSSEDLEFIKRNSLSNIRNKISRIEAKALDKLSKETGDSPDDIA